MFSTLSIFLLVALASCVNAQFASNLDQKPKPLSSPGSGEPLSPVKLGSRKLDSGSGTLDSSLPKPDNLPKVSFSEKSLNEVLPSEVSSSDLPLSANSGTVHGLPPLPAKSSSASDDSSSSGSGLPSVDELQAQNHVGHSNSESPSQKDPNLINSDDLKLSSKEHKNLVQQIVGQKSQSDSSESSEDNADDLVTKIVNEVHTVDNLPSTHTLEIHTTNIGSVEDSSEESCEDKHEKCPHLVASGLCEDKAFGDSVTQQCKKGCGHCQRHEEVAGSGEKNETKCEDTSNICFLGQHFCNSISILSTNQMCKKSCNQCGKSGEIDDKRQKSGESSSQIKMKNGATQDANERASKLQSKEKSLGLPDKKSDFN